MLVNMALHQPPETPLHPLLGETTRQPVCCRREASILLRVCAGRGSKKSRICIHTNKLRLSPRLYIHTNKLRLSPRLYIHTNKLRLSPRLYKQVCEGTNRLLIRLVSQERTRSRHCKGSGIPTRHCKGSQDSR